MKPRIRSSIGIVKNGKDQIELFKGNIRRSVMLKINTNVAEILCNLDGTRTLNNIVREFDLDQEAQKNFESLILYLMDRGIIVDEEKRIFDSDREIYSRVFSLLEDYSKDEGMVRRAWNNIKSARVLIVGLGAVGSWIVANLVQSGVKKLTLMDNDIVELSNLHRQWGYVEEDINTPKTIALKRRLLEIDENLDINLENVYLEEQTLNRFDEQRFDLVINCADKPTVDQTAEWVGAFCMKYNIPHIIAGGYNLHLSLIGQTIIPNKTACIKCFEHELRKRNELETSKMKKLARESRKIGSFGPMCTISASFASTEAIKVLSKLIPPTNINRRGEFNIYSMDIKYHYVEKLLDCEWCGETGKYTT